jgi:hypothetical protein
MPLNKKKNPVEIKQYRQEGKQRNAKQWRMFVRKQCANSLNTGHFGTKVAAFFLTLSRK